MKLAFSGVESFRMLAHALSFKNYILLKIIRFQNIISEITMTAE
jgi:hypothetical protein